MTWGCLNLQHPCVCLACPPYALKQSLGAGTTLLLTPSSFLCRHCTAPSRTRSCSGPCEYPSGRCCCPARGGQRRHRAGAGVSSLLLCSLQSITLPQKPSSAEMLQSRCSCEDVGKTGRSGCSGDAGNVPCLPLAPPWGHLPRHAAGGTLRPAPHGFGVASWLGGRVQIGSGQAMGDVAVPRPRGVPAPSPTAAISSSRSGSARAAGINQPGRAASTEPMRSGCCHGDAGRC